MTIQKLQLTATGNSGKGLGMGLRRIFSLAMYRHRDFKSEFMLHEGRRIQNPKSLRRYQNCVDNFHSFLKLYAINPLRVTVDDVEHFIDHRLPQVSPATINDELRILKTFYNWLQWRGHVTYNPCAGVAKVRERIPEVEIYSESDLAKMFTAIKAHSLGPKYWPMYCVLALTGMRSGELINLEWTDIDFERRLIQVRDKHGWTHKSKRPRSVPINDELMDILLQVRAGRQDAPYVFASPEGRRLGNNCLYIFLQNIAVDLRMQKLKVKTFRSTFITALYEQANIPTVFACEMVGHEDLNTQKPYIARVGTRALKYVQQLQFPLHGERTAQQKTA